MTDPGGPPTGAPGGMDRESSRARATESEQRPARLNRELIELLNELRIGLPGVQVLFAFLLTVPFTQRFSRLDGVQRAIYFLAVLATAMASAFLIAPSAYHRLRWRHRDKERMLVTSNHLAVIGIAFLALAISAVIYVITSVVYNNSAAAGAAAGVAAVVTWLWFGLPLSRRLEE